MILASSRKWITKDLTKRDREREKDQQRKNPNNSWEKDRNKREERRILRQTKEEKVGLKDPHLGMRTFETLISEYKAYIWTEHISVQKDRSKNHLINTRDFQRIESITLRKKRNFTFFPVLGRWRSRTSISRTNPSLVYRSSFSLTLDLSFSCLQQQYTG
jgi:hypothetical protein